MAEGRASTPIALDADPGESASIAQSLDGAAARDVLRKARSIAVVGASPHEWRASHRVMAYLLGQGYECIPITPNAREVLGQTCHASLEAAA